MKWTRTGDKKLFIKIRVSPEYKRNLFSQAQKSNLTLSEYLRRAVELFEKEQKREAFIE